MTFKFTLLGLEFSKGSPAYTNINIEKEKKMTKRKSSKKQLAQQKKFKKAYTKCRKTTDSKKDFGSCMSENLTKKKTKSKEKKK